jgi:hypothetical protein
MVIRVGAWAMAWIMQQTVGAVEGGLVELARSGESQSNTFPCQLECSERDSSASSLPEFPLAAIILSGVA